VSSTTETVTAESTNTITNEVPTTEVTNNKNEGIEESKDGEEPMDEGDDDEGEGAEEEEEEEDEDEEEIEVDDEGLDDLIDEE
jgi:hypothetical protein